MRKVCKTLLVIVFILMFVLWGSMVYIDMQNVNNNKSGELCLKTSINKYSDGEVGVCYGLGYKIFTYNRECFKGIEFASIFDDDQTISLNECNN